MSEPVRPQVVMLSTIHASHARHSGYVRLAEYVPGAELLHAPRADPASGLPRFAARVARRFAFSRWYLGGCAALEWQAFRRLRRGFEGVVHSLWSDHDLGYLDLFLQRPRQRLCGTFHNCPADFPHTLRFPRRLRKFDAIVLMSECQRPFFLAAGVAEEKIHVVLHGVDTVHFTPQARPPGPFTVLSAGGYRRNFPLLREVCRLLAGEPDLHFDIVAPPAHAPLFQEMPHVRFSSGLSDDEFLARYRAASCLLHTTEQTTANNVVLEALACGLPVVAERIGGLPEYTTPDCALLTDPGDAGALAEAIRTLARDAALATRLSAAARRRAEELAWPLVGRRMSALYATL